VAIAGETAMDPPSGTADSLKYVPSHQFLLRRLLGLFDRPTVSCQRIDDLLHTVKKRKVPCETALREI
jgi:hypothetical protein